MSQGTHHNDWNLCTQGLEPIYHHKDISVVRGSPNRTRVMGYLFWGKGIETIIPEEGCEGEQDSFECLFL